MWLFWLIGALILLFGFVVFWGAPYVPSKKRDINEALSELYALGKKDVLLDIGSGDGIVLRMASRRGARAIGYELNPVLVLLSRFLSRNDKKVSVQLANFWHVPFPSDVTVVYTFGESRDIKKMASRVAREAERLGRPIFFISYAFAVPGDTPVKTAGAYFLYTYKPLQIKKA